MKRKITFLVTAIVLLGIFAGYIYQQTHETQTAKVAIAVQNAPTVQELWQLTNTERVKAGLQPIPLDPRLNVSAQNKADDEVKYGYFDHYNPITHERGINYIFASYPTCKIGSENLTENTTINTSQRAITAFMTSPAHRAALLSPKDIAVGFGISGKEIVQHFCQV